MLPVQTNRTRCMQGHLITRLIESRSITNHVKRVRQEHENVNASHVKFRLQRRHSTVVVLQRTFWHWFRLQRNNSSDRYYGSPRQLFLQRTLPSFLALVGTADLCVRSIWSINACIKLRHVNESCRGVWGGFLLSRAPFPATAASPLRRRKI